MSVISTLALLVQATLLVLFFFLHEQVPGEGGLGRIVLDVALLLAGCGLLVLGVLIFVRERRIRQTLADLKETRWRYQRLFDNGGMALCVLDLSGMRRYLARIDPEDSASLRQWLQDNPKLHPDLLWRLRVTEANAMALHLLSVTDTHELWRQLFGEGRIRTNGVGFQLLMALLSGQQALEVEVQLAGADGQTRYLWVSARLPGPGEDDRAVPLALNDITARKQVELSLSERERFWSSIAYAVPDMLYVQDLVHHQELFSNYRLSRQLGYDSIRPGHLKLSFLESILHPDDREIFRHLWRQRRSLTSGQLLQGQLRFRHQNGQWHWFDIREQSMAQDSRGQVTRVIGIIKDITGQIEASESLRRSERRYRLLAESISDVIFSSDSRLRLNYISPSVQGILGYPPDWFLKNDFSGVIANPLQIHTLTRLLARVRRSLGNARRLDELRGDGHKQLVVDCLRADGRKVPVELRIMPMWDDAGSFQGLLGVGRDISQQRHAERELRMAATVFEHSAAAILVIDPAGFIVQVNRAFTRISGFRENSILDQTTELLAADASQAGLLQHVFAQLGTRGSWEGEVWLKRRAGERYPAWVGITAVQDEEGDLVSYVFFFSDISERKASEQRINRLAYYDALTQLPNRTLFQDRLQQALQHVGAQNSWIVLMFLDLDRFKPINDSLGHAAGDRILKDVALRLSGCVSAGDTVARMGGDEFTLLLEPCTSRHQAQSRAVQVAGSILKSLSRVFVLDEREFFVTASIGIALSPEDGRESNQLMKNADTAMYHAKEVGKNNFQFYEAEMNARALERLELENDLRHALNNRQFLLYYQPQLSSDGQRITGTEALLRWQHPRRGMVSPAEFVPVLEELGLVVQVGDWVLTEACRQMQAWRDAGLAVPKISVNLSARQFVSGLASRVAAVLAGSGLPADCLELELTESILMRDVKAAMLLLDDLKCLGLFIAVDDFGTGYSSLNYLKQFPIDVLKIDRSFVDGLPDGKQDAQIARAIIAMSHSLNLLVIAEGVETREQLDFLREHGCDEIQGYLFGRPMPAAQFADFCRQHQAQADH